MSKFLKIENFLKNRSNSKILLKKLYFLTATKQIVIRLCCENAVQRWTLISMVNCNVSKLRHPKKCYVQDIGFLSIPEGHSIVYPYISQWFTASIWLQDLIYYYILNGLHFLDPQQQLGGSY